LFGWTDYTKFSKAIVIGTKMNGFKAYMKATDVPKLKYFIRL